MKKILVLLAAFLLAASSASALNFIDSYWDLNAVDDPYFPVAAVAPSDGITEPFYEILYHAQTNSLINTTTGVVTDAGLARATALNFVSGNDPGDDEGFGLASGYGLTFVWNDLTGQVTSNVGGIIEAIYTSGTFDFYIDYDPYATNFANPASFTDGVKVATVEITSGSYRLDTNDPAEAGSSYLLLGTFSYLLEDFWFDAATGQDLSALPLGWVFAYTAGDNDPETVEITPTADGFSVFSTHDSSVSVGIVPEPSTFALLGLGLLGAGMLARRRSHK